MAGKKKALLDTIATSSELLVAAFAASTTAISDIPAVDTPKYTDQMAHCRDKIGPSLREMLEAMLDLKRSVTALTSYFKKANTLLETIRADLKGFYEGLWEWQKDVLNVSRDTKDVLAELLEE